MTFPYISKKRHVHDPTLYPTLPYPAWPHPARPYIIQPCPTLP